MSKPRTALLAVVTSLMFFSSVPAVALAQPDYRFTPDSSGELKLAPKEASAVEVLDAFSKRAQVRLGQLAIKGDATSSREELIAFAKVKAAELGADFVVISPASGEMTQHSHVPAGGAGGFGMQRHRSTHVLSTSQMLWTHIGVFAKATLGLEYLDPILTAARPVVKNFRASSKAPDAGMLLGDEIVAVDGISVVDDIAGYRKWILGIEAGQIAHVSLKREGAALQIDVPLVANQ